MDFKFNSLYNKIYRGFITGEYGAPKIPSKAEVVRKMEEITTRENIPILKETPIAGIQIKEIQKKFKSTIDDVDVLFDTIESESKAILDQLTYSLKEHRGAKRELRRIRARSKDINNGQLGEEYLNYNFTETFDDLTNINTLRSDPIFTEAGIFSISREKDQILSLSHYYGTKLEWSIIENYAQVSNQTYIGSTDAATMLDQSDARQLIYRITTSRPTRLRTSVSFQLTPDGRAEEINGVTIDLDSSVSRGQIRLYYRDQHKWLDVRTASIQEIKGDKVVYNFPNTITSHIKIEFIKDVPDISDGNHYYYVMNNLAIFRGTSKRSAVLYSKPITFASYDKEAPIITRVQASGDIQLPDRCEARLYVAQDVAIQGQFLDSGGEAVYADSPNAVSFDSSASGTVYLSDIWNAESTISGIEVYRGLDFTWRPLKSFSNTGEKIPDVIEFNNTRSKPTLDNSIFNIVSPYVFGDLDYTGVFPASGWVNTDNSAWAIYLEDLVNSGVLVSGVEITTDVSGNPITWIEDISGSLNPAVYSHPDFSGQWIGKASGAGYPFGYVIPSLDRVFRFGEYDSSINGWWRPLSTIVTPSGIEIEQVISENLVNPSYVTYLPDFYFNGLDFYKIYKFGIGEEVIDPTIKLYAYQERPVTSESGYYPSAFTWKYKSRWQDEVGVKENIRMSTPPDSWDTYVIPVSASTLRPNEEYIVDAIEEIRIHGTNVTLDTSEYFTVPRNDPSQITGINLSGFGETTNYPPSGTSFDFKYRYRVKNEYLSSWIGYAIVSPGNFNPTITIANQDIEDKDIPLINNIVVTNLDTNDIKVVNDEGNIFNVLLDRVDSTKPAHFKITIYCASDENTGFCAEQWIPYEGTHSKTLTISPGIKLVSRIKPISLVDLSTLIYDTPINDDSRAALLTEGNNEKYLVVKQPSKDIFPGYYFDSLAKTYIEDDASKIENVGHWIRQGVSITYESIPGYSGLVPVVSGIIDYTTGSDDNNVVYKFDRSTTDDTWNNGTTLADYPNSTDFSFYPHHSTFAYPINVDRQSTKALYLQTGYTDPRAPYDESEVGSAAWINWVSVNYPSDYNQWLSDQTINTTDYNRGFLFFDTAENLPTFYSITYKTVIGDSDINKRFLYRLELTSDEENNLTPVVRSLRFSINDRL